MRLISTRGEGAPEGKGGEASFRSAILRGLAPDGGLYLPAELPRFTPDELARLRGAGFREIARAVALRLLEPTLGGDRVRECVEGAFDFPVPVVELDDAAGTRVLELFHGPTGSFKDIGARFLAQLLSRLRGPGEERIAVLVATSGDTGGAVARAVHGLPGVDAVVLHPEGRLSPIQLQHLSVPEEAGARGEVGVVRSVSVRGSFDDCQRMVKEVLAEGSPAPGIVVTSANSVNVGRLLPQVFFHVHGWAQAAAAGEPLLVSIPSANLGNVTAAMMARRMGVPIGGLVAATNRNGALAHFLRTGTPPSGPSVETLSSAMDVARPSNLERLLALTGSDPEALRDEVVATTHDDDATLDAIRELDRSFGYLADPHTAVGWLGLEEVRAARHESRALLVATADPAKFPETVRRATGHDPPARSDWAAEAAALARAHRHARGGRDLASIEPDTEAFREIVRALR